MSAPDRDVLSALALQTIDLLAQYEADCARLCTSWFDAELYRSACRSVDRIRACSGSLQGTSVSSAALLIAHAELVFTLWRGGELERPRNDHAACVAALRRACLRELRWRAA